MWSRSSPSVDPDSTVYDLASLTKAMATTTALMLLIERGMVRLYAPVTTCLPELDTAAPASLTEADLLAHTSAPRAHPPHGQPRAIPARPPRLSPRPPP